MSETDKFWQGWMDALEALDTRLEVYQTSINSHTKAWDILLDIKSEITDLLDLTNMRQ